MTKTSVEEMAAKVKAAQQECDYNERLAMVTQDNSKVDQIEFVDQKGYTQSIRVGAKLAETIKDLLTAELVRRKAAFEKKSFTEATF